MQEENFMDRLLPLLGKCRLFQNNSTGEIEGLLSRINYRIASFSENEIIFSPLHKADKMGILLSGSVDVQKLFPAGKVVIIERKKSPDLIAESSLFSTLDFYPDTYSVCKPCKIMFLQKTELLDLFKADPAFLLNFLELVSDSTLFLKHKIGILSLDSIQEKIAGYLVHYKNHDCKAGMPDIITLPFSKKAWAEYMNVSRTSLSRELRKLEGEGILSFEKRVIKINSWKRLETILSL